MSNIVGYISTGSNFAYASPPHAVQNLVIRKFVEDLKMSYLLSWSEFNKLGPMVFKSLLQENFYSGICFFSINQLYESTDYISLLKNMRTPWLGFASEKIIISTNEELSDFVKTFSLRRYIDINLISSKAVWEYLDHS